MIMTTHFIFIKVDLADCGITTELTVHWKYIYLSDKDRAIIVYTSKTLFRIVVTTVHTCFIFLIKDT